MTKCVGPSAHMGDLDEFLVFWLSPEPASAVAAIEGVNHQTEHLSLSGSLPFK